MVRRQLLLSVLVNLVGCGTVVTQESVDVQRSEFLAEPAQRSEFIARQTSPTGPGLTGTLPRNEVLRGINGRMTVVTRCYESGLIKNPGLHGRLVLQWVVTPAGTVSDVTVLSSSLSDEPTVECVVDAVRSIHFAQTGGDSTITFPFAFRAVDM